MEKKICCISAKADWYESSKLCKSINQKLNINIDVLSSDCSIQDYELIIYIHSSKSASDKIVNKWLKEASDLNKSFIPVIIGGNWISNMAIIASYGGPNLRTDFLQFCREEDTFDFYNRIASFAGVQLNGDVIGAQVTILADKSCKVYRNNACIANVQEGIPYLITLYTGTHRLVFKAIEDENIQHEENINVASTNDSYTINASFKVARPLLEQTNASYDNTDSSSNRAFIIVVSVVIIAIVGAIILFVPNSNTSKLNESLMSDIVDSIAVDSANTVDEESVIKEFITKMYDEKLYEDYDFLEKHCSGHLLKQLEDANNCDTVRKVYAVWNFRTCSQDGKEGSEEPNRVINVESSGDGWYTYEFYDGGWHGKNRIKVYIQNDVVVMDVLEHLYDECAESGQQSSEKEKERILALLETDGKHTLEGSITNNNEEYNSELVRITFTQEDGTVYNCVYFNDGVLDENRGEIVEMHGIRTAEGYHFESNEGYDELIVDITFKDLSFKGYAKRSNGKFPIDLNLE